MKVVRLQGVIHIENKLQFLRELRDWKQQDVANALGVSRSTYANYESGRRAPDLSILMNLGDIYGISLDELTGHKVKQSNSLQLTNQASYGCGKNGHKKIGISIAVNRNAYFFLIYVPSSWLLLLHL